MATYYDKKRNTYYYSTYVKLSTGENKRFLKRGFKTRNEAKKAEIDFLYNFDVEDEESISFGKLTEMYLSWYEKRRKKSSYDRVESMLRMHILPLFEHKKIKDIKKRDIAILQDQLLTDLSVSTAKLSHRTLSAVFNYAIRLDYIKTNVAREVGNIDVKSDKRIEFYTLDEFKTFINVVDDLMYRTFFMMLFYGGFRRGELMALTWNDIYFKLKVIDIHKTANNYVVTSPKNETSNRKIQLPQHTIDLLSELKKEVKPKNDYVVFGEFYDHLPQTTINRRYDEYINKTKLDKIRIHDFRHSHASYLINLGIDITIISKRLGHAKTSTTHDIYGHLYPNAEDAAIAKMENDFKPAQIIKISDYQ